MCPGEYLYDTRNFHHRLWHQKRIWVSADTFPVKQQFSEHWYCKTDHVHKLLIAIIFTNLMAMIIAQFLALKSLGHTCLQNCTLMATNILKLFCQLICLACSSTNNTPPVHNDWNLLMHNQRDCLLQRTPNYTTLILMFKNLPTLWTSKSDCHYVVSIKDRDWNMQLTAVAHTELVNRGMPLFCNFVKCWLLAECSGNYKLH